MRLTDTVSSRPSDQTETEVAAKVEPRPRAPGSALTNALDPLLSLQRIAKAHGLTTRDIRGRDRHRDVVKVRRIVASTLRAQGMTVEEIGDVMHRDHTTVLNLLDRLGFGRLDAPPRPALTMRNGKVVPWRSHRKKETAA
jgi:sulfur carrier protein ThiS